MDAANRAAQRIREGARYVVKDAGAPGYGERIFIVLPDVARIIREEYEKDEEQEIPVPDEVRAAYAEKMARDVDAIMVEDAKGESA
jgi:hypothetical protein